MSPKARLVITAVVVEKQPVAQGGGLLRELEIDTTRDGQRRHPPTRNDERPNPHDVGPGVRDVLKHHMRGRGRIRTCDRRLVSTIGLQTVLTSMFAGRRLALCALLSYR
jgi:hypothetical protein